MQLGKILTYKKGRAPSKSKVSDQLLVYLTPDYLRNQVEPNYVEDFVSKVEVNEGDLLLLWDGSNAGEFFKAKSGILSSTMVKLDFDERIYNKAFIYYQLKSIEDYLKIQTNGSGIPHVDKEILFNIDVREFNDDDQLKIASILVLIDKSIKETESILAKFQRIKTGLIQHILSNGIDENGDIRDESSHTFIFKNGIRVPEEWNVDILGNNCYIHNNLRKPISALERFKNRGIYPYYGATGIIDFIGEFRVEGKYVLIGEDGDHYLKFNKQEMTHLVEGKFNVSNHAHILSGKGECLTDWIHYYYSHKDITLYLTRQGAGRFKLNKQSLQNLPIAIPKQDEQKRIISFLKANNHNLNNFKASLEKLLSIKKGLMNDLLQPK